MSCAATIKPIVTCAPYGPPSAGFLPGITVSVKVWAAIGRRAVIVGDRFRQGDPEHASRQWSGNDRCVISVEERQFRPAGIRFEGHQHERHFRRLLVGAGDLDAAFVASCRAPLAPAGPRPRPPPSPRQGDGNADHPLPVCFQPGLRARLPHRSGLAFQRFRKARERIGRRSDRLVGIACRGEFLFGLLERGKGGRVVPPAIPRPAARSAPDSVPLR